MNMDAAGVLAVLPHRYPMLLVDRVLAVEPGERLTAVKAVTFGESWYQRFGADVRQEDLAYPQALLLESWGQAAGILGLLGHPDPTVADDTVMVVGSAVGVRFHGPVFPGDVLEHDVRMFRALSDTMIFEGVSRRGGEVVFEVDRMTMALRPADVLQPAEASA
jgi:3-hydroxyacyl-[acyl-carrier-protein] dehydratase